MSGVRGRRRLRRGFRCRRPGSWRTCDSCRAWRSSPGAGRPSRATSRSTLPPSCRVRIGSRRPAWLRSRRASRHDELLPGLESAPTRSGARHRRFGSSLASTRLGPCHRSSCELARSRRTRRRWRSSTPPRRGRRRSSIASLVAFSACLRSSARLSATGDLRSNVRSNRTTVRSNRRSNTPATATNVSASQHTKPLVRGFQVGYGRKRAHSPKRCSGAGGNRTPVHQPVNEPATTIPGIDTDAVTPTGRLSALGGPRAVFPTCQRSFPLSAVFPAVIPHFCCRAVMDWPRAALLLTMIRSQPENQAARAKLSLSTAIVFFAPFSESEQLGSQTRTAILTSKPVSPVINMCSARRSAC